MAVRIVLAANNFLSLAKTGIYAEDLDQKIKIFKSKSATKKTLFLTMVTTFGVNENEYKTRFVQNEITMDALFEK